MFTLFNLKNNTKLRKNKLKNKQNDTFNFMFK